MDIGKHIIMIYYRNGTKYLNYNAEKNELKQ